MACPYPDHPCLFRNYCLEGKKFVLKMPMTIFGYVNSKCLDCGAVLPVVASGGVDPICECCFGGAMEDIAEELDEVAALRAEAERLREERMA